MKLKRKIIALAMAATFTISMVSTAFADTPPHLMYGTEKTYGEESTQHKPLYQDEYDRFHIVKDIGVIQSILPIKR